ncbi:MAG: hypothetical protein VR65_19425 [Desulfobulbaceae bacterium BRH_c16a]|nr:MAG: hypothetical protein VR65_19425 [Desulfobulbaceae bacterium BRH_c16a]
MQEIIASFAQKHRMTMTEVMTEIERTFSSMLSKWYGLDVMVHFRDDLQLEAVVYNEIGGVVRQQLIDFTKMRGLNTLKKHLEDGLGKAALIKQTTRYKYYEKELRWGEIAARDSENNFHVETEIIPGEKILAVCPLNRIGLHERNTRNFSIGMKRAFHLRRIESIMLNGTPRLKIVVDRVSKTLVETLLEDHLGPIAEKLTIRCTKRYVGHKSFVLSSKKLPKSAILAVTRELGEKMEVRFLKNT